MQHHLLLELAALLTAVAQDSLPAAQTERGEVRQRVEAVATAAVDEGVPGVSIAVGKDSELWFAEGFGYADAAQGEPATGDTAYRVGTLARQFTAVGILHLVEAGKLKLDDDLAKVLPAFPAWGGGITVEHLLAGTSGIPSWRRITGETPTRPTKPKEKPPKTGAGDGNKEKEAGKEQRPAGGGEFWLPPAAQDPQISGGQDKEKGDRASSPDPAEGERQILARFLGVEPEFPPGEGYSADSAGWLVLDLILARTAGQPLEDFVRTRWIEPLELEHTTFCPTTKRWIQTADDCKQLELERDAGAQGASASSETPSGLCSSAADLFRWTAALANRELLGEESMHKMWSPGIVKDGATTNAGFATKIGALEQFRVVGHTGGVGGYAVRVAHYPEVRVTVVVLANCATAPIERMEEAIARAVLGVLPAEIADLPLEEANVPRYAGTYMIVTTRIRVFEKDGKLWWEEPAQPAFALLHQGRGVFLSSADRQTRYTFLGEEDKPADKVEVVRGGLMSTGQRVAQDSGGRLAPEPRLRLAPGE